MVKYAPSPIRPPLQLEPSRLVVTRVAIGPPAVLPAEPLDGRAEVVDRAKVLRAVGVFAAAGIHILVEQEHQLAVVAWALRRHNSFSLVSTAGFSESRGSGAIAVKQLFLTTQTGELICLGE